MTSQRLKRSCTDRRASRRGFTVVELISAITASMVVAAGAYMMARTSLTVFQQEARMNSAQFSNIMGMNRLVTDAKRAGYQSTPDPASDPVSVCNKPTGTLGTMLTAVRVLDEDISVSALYMAVPPVVLDPINARIPDRIRFAGNYTTSERFKLANVDVAAGEMAIECDQLAVQRIFKDSLAGGPKMCDLFPDDTIVRVVDPAGKAQFVTVDVGGCTQVVNGTTTNFTQVKLKVVGLGAGGCVTDPSQGYVNPVNVVEYVMTNMDILTLLEATTIGLPASIKAAGGYASADALSAGVTGEPSRMTLIRRVLDGAGNVVPNSGEVVADYVADLKFSARVANPGVAGLVAIPFTTDLTTIPPNRIRSLGVRLTTRAKTPDRAEGPNPPPNEDTPLTLFSVFPTGSVMKDKYARVRTLNMEVNVPNLGAYLPW